MVIEINFTPQRLKSLVVELEKVIGVATGQPVRLDIELFLESLKKYKDETVKANIPSLATLEKLSVMIPRLQEEDLFEAFFDCLRNTTNARITSAILFYYFNNYKDIRAKNYLLKSIHIEALSNKGWEVWSQHREIFFNGNVTENIAQYIIQQKIPLQEVAGRLGMLEPYSIREDSLSFLCGNKSLFSSYLKALPLEAILKILKDDQLQRLHTSIWDYTLPLYGPEAKEQKIKDDIDHPLFTLAKVRLQPTKSPQWIRISEPAKASYQDWAIGSRLEVFLGDSDRIRFWKRQLSKIDGVKEVTYRGYVEAFSIVIGKYEFIEFKDIGAVYVYPKGIIRIPSRVTNLDDLKFRDKVVNAHMGVENGEGWIAHLGRVWPNRINRLINEALRT